MKPRTPLTVSLLSSAVALAAISMPTHAQTRTPAAAAGKTGLNALDEASVYYELDGRGMADLLERAFKVNNVSPEQQKEILSARVITELLTKRPSDFNARQRREIVSKLSGNLDKILSPIKDPAKMVTLAVRIEEIGVANEVSLIDFWGEDPTGQAQLRPAAEAVLKLYQNAENALNEKMNQIAAKITGPNDPNLAEVDKLEQSKNNLQYARSLYAHYAVAISLDKSDERRAKICDEAIEFLKQFDNDQAGDQWPLIKLQLGKLLMAKGDYPEAIKTLKSLYEKPKDFSPEPPPELLSNARMMHAIAELLAQNTDAAAKQLAETVAWQQANLKDPEKARPIADAVAVLRARIAWQRAEKAANPADKTKFNEEATVVLTKLTNERKHLAPLINEQLLKRLPADVKLDKLDTLLLQAMVGRAGGEVNLETPNKDFLKQGVAAARELLKRKGQPGVDDKTVDNTMINLALYHQKLGELREAATAFLDYVEFPKADPERRVAALEAGVGIILRDLKGGTDPEAADLYDRAIPIAINAPFNHTELAYQWGLRMQRLSKTDEAIKYFRMVPATDPRALQAKYRLAFALNAKLDDTKLTPAQRTAIATDILKAADEVEKAAAKGLAGQLDDVQKRQYRAMLGGVKLTSATVALDVQQDARKAIDVLKDLETVVAGMEGTEPMLTDAMGIRIRAYVALGEDPKAVDLVLKYAEIRPKEAMGMVHQLNTRIGKEVDKARTAGDMKRVAALAPTRVTLTKILVDWIRNNPKPEIKAQTFRAESQLANVTREAAQLQDDPAKRKELFAEVLKLYESLLAQPEAKKDPGTSGGLTAGIGLISYDLGEYQKCIDMIVPLLRERRLGEPYNLVNGEYVENTLYWEARYKVLRSFVELARAKNNDPGMLETVAKELRTIYAQINNPGGEKWGEDFEKLRKEFAPDIQVNQAAATEPTTKPGDLVD